MTIGGSPPRHTVSPRSRNIWAANTSPCLHASSIEVTGRVRFFGVLVFLGAVCKERSSNTPDTDADDDADAGADDDAEAEADARADADAEAAAVVAPESHRQYRGQVKRRRKSRHTAFNIQSTRARLFDVAHEFEVRPKLRKVNALVTVGINCFEIVSALC